MEVPCIVVVFPRIAADPWKNHDQAEDATFKRAVRWNRSTAPVKPAAYGLLFASRHWQPIGVQVVASQHCRYFVMQVRVRGTSNLHSNGYLGTSRKSACWCFVVSRISKLTQYD